MKSLKYITFYFLASIIFSCDVITSEEENHQLYNYDINALIQKTVKDMDQTEVIVKKKVNYDGKTSEISVSDINWDSELEVFNDADINRPIFKDSYKKVETKEGQDIKIKYTSQSDKNEVKWLEITQNDQGITTSIQFLIKSKNALFQKEKVGKLTYSNDGFLNQYSIQGNQDVVILGQKNYNIEAFVSRN
ncbi:hypothetical protein KMW28_04255 [Flammeovirga yaeyamensis]|uniref:Lipoprotein n=1 Tax=Flammeovirga yaeyamensis TaxID=367791 RepID=A0AAX1N9S7_9BACT|nr:hypothetical protein [Flammeovirga yaeyamensis]MBB3697368.1 hypothetical protein [Flammeovirga yaeyamensis]NMF36062.1 hypothetical protein [Flammeovirga yaeyamensis]QWG02797.1 hypothetical protein KMW28_04255 [Flammeovirga yaeyamensis]